MTSKTLSHLLCPAGWKHLQPSSPPGCSFSLFGLDDMVKPEDHSNCKSCGSWSGAPAGADPSQTKSWLLLGLVTFLAALHLSSIQLKSIQGWICSALCCLSKKGTKPANPKSSEPTPPCSHLFCFLPLTGRCLVPNQQSFLVFQLWLCLPTSHPPVSSPVYSCPSSHTQTSLLQLVPVSFCQAVRRADHREDANKFI